MRKGKHLKHKSVKPKVLKSSPRVCKTIGDVVRRSPRFSTGISVEEPSVEEPTVRKRLSAKDKGKEKVVQEESVC